MTLKDQVEAFLFNEAHLLDSQQWQAWADLFAEEGTYWVPATPGQADPLSHVSLMYEDKLLRAVRIKRFGHPHAFSLQPMPRSVHLISNIVAEETSGGAVARSKFIMLHYRRDQQDVYGGTCTHTLVRSGQAFLIKQKKVELVNCDAALGSIQLYF